MDECYRSLCPRVCVCVWLPPTATFLLKGGDWAECVSVCLHDGQIGEHLCLPFSRTQTDRETDRQTVDRWMDGWMN